MKWILSCIVILVLVMTVNVAHASDWRALATLNNGTQIFIDQSSLVTTYWSYAGMTHPLREAWVKYVYPKPMKKVKASLWFTKISCSDDTWVADSYIEYDAKGRLVDSNSDSYAPPIFPEAPIPPDSSLEEIRNYFCASK